MKEWILKLSTPKKLAFIAALLGLVAFIIGNPTSNNKILVNAKELALSTIKEQDKVTVLELADWLIKEKGDFTLVDLRSEKDYAEYNIPTSVNIPLENILNSDLMRNQKILLYGNDDISSAQAWFILKSANYKSVYILSGGFNAWKNEILYPKLLANATEEQKMNFEKLKQVSAFFGGTPQIVSEGTVTSAVEQKTPTANLPKISAPSGGAKPAKKKKEGC